MVLLLAALGGGGYWAYKNRALLFPEPVQIIAASEPEKKEKPQFVLNDLPPEPEEPPPPPPVIDFTAIEEETPSTRSDKIKGTGIIAVVQPRINKDPSEIDKLAWKYRATPRKPLPVPLGDAKLRDKITEMLDAYEMIPVEKTVAHPAAREFPGSVSGVTPRIHCVFPLKPGKGGWRSTGLYAPPGEIITVKVNPRHVDLDLGVQIGCFTDDIQKKRELWHRFPRITRHFRIDAETILIANPFGGPIYFTPPGNLASRLPKGDADVKIAVIGAVQAPYYELGVTTREQWIKSKSDGRAPWAELACNGVILSVPRALLSEVQDPEKLMQVWERIIQEQDWLAGIKDRTTPERLVPDAEISVGFMHSGYPVKCYLSSAKGMVDVKYLTKEGDWGFYHEYGHNRQRGEWTFDGYGEVTNNLFSLLCMERISGQSLYGRLTKKEVMEALADVINSPENAGPFELLAQYIPVLDKFGWDSLQKTFYSYHENPIRFPNVPKEAPAAEKRIADDARKAEFVVRWSLNCQANLAPYFACFGFPNTPEMKERLAGLKTWKPENFPPRGVKRAAIRRKLSDNEAQAEAARK